MKSMLADHARSFGPITVGGYRVVVLESGGKVTWHDYASLDDARAHANDAASELDVPWPVTAVFDSQFATVHVGEHYALSPR